MTTVAEHPDEVSLAPQPAPAAPRSRARTLLPVLSLVVAATTGGIWYAGRGKEKTDDAFVEGRVAMVASRVPGQVKQVLVKDNQRVEAGQVLVELDDQDLQVRLRAARADLAAARASLEAAETQRALTEKTAESNLVVARGGLAQAHAVAGTTTAGIEQAQADVKAAEARLGLARFEVQRSDQLIGAGVFSTAERDPRRANLEQAEAALAQAQARLAAARAGVANSHGTVEAARGRLLAAGMGPEQVEAARAQVTLAQAKVEQTQAALDQAELNLSYTRVKAPAAGVVARRSVEAGQMVGPERSLLAVVPLDDVWVVANFKEDQIAHMHEGQPVTIKVDAYGGKELVGHVDSLAAGTGSRFSLLPPDNASGNFTKVVQRVPVLIRVNPDPAVVLRPGLSVLATVFTR